MDVQWLSYHFNVEHMLHVALEQLHHLESTDEEIDRVNEFFSFAAHSLRWFISE